MSDNMEYDASNQILYKSHQIKLFMLLAEKTVEKMCDGVTVEEFREIMENISFLKQKPKSIYKSYSLFRQNLKRTVLSELAEMVEEDGFDDKFCQLNDLINAKDSSNELPAWRPSGNVNEDIRSHLMLVKLKQKSELDRCLREKESFVNNLMIKVKDIRAEAQKECDKLSDLTNHINNISEQYREELTKIKNS